MRTGLSAGSETQAAHVGEKSQTAKRSPTPSWGWLCGGRANLVGGALIAALGSLAMGCSDLADPEDTYSQVYRALLPEQWACLDNPEPLPATAMPDPTGFPTYTGFVLDYRSVMPMAADLRGCLITDFACEQGVGQGVMVPPLNAGLPPGVRIALPVGFEGFFRITAPGYIPYDYYLLGPMVSAVVQPQPFNLVSETSFVEFVRGMGADPAVVASQGVLAVQVLDCNSDPAPGVELRLADREDRPSLQTAQGWAIQRRIPVLNQVTDAQGLAGFINLPIENVVVEASVEGRVFGRTSFRIDVGRLTGATMRPSYATAY